MLTVTTDIGKCLAIVEFSASRKVWLPSSPDPTNRAGLIPSSGSFSASLTRSLNDKGGGGGGGCGSGSQNHIHRVPNTPHGMTSRWLCRSVPLDDDEYRSSRNIAITLFRRYKTVVERGGGENLKEFISAGVNAYALGCTSNGLRDELADLKESGVEIEATQISSGNTSVKAKIFSEEIDKCILWLSIVFITILCTPQPTVIRWSSVPPVSDELLVKWKGFCGIIANAYYIRGMAWLPVKTLQLEQLATVGCAEEASVVASRMRLVFSTLEVVSPQWPRV